MQAIECSLGQQTKRLSSNCKARSDASYLFFLQCWQTLYLYEPTKKDLITDGYKFCFILHTRYSINFHAIWLLLTEISYLFLRTPNMTAIRAAAMTASTARTTPMTAPSDRTPATFPSSRAPSIGPTTSPGVVVGGSVVEVTVVTELWIK